MKGLKSFTLTSGIGGTSTRKLGSQNVSSLIKLNLDEYKFLYNYSVSQLVMLYIIICEHSSKILIIFINLIDKFEPSVTVMKSCVVIKDNVLKAMRLYMIVVIKLTS